MAGHSEPIDLFAVDAPTEPMPLDELDRRLAEGWFRSGPVLFRADMLYVSEDIRGLVQIRLPLDRREKHRSHRRLLRSNRKRFRIEIGPARVDEDRERLYELMKPRFVSPVSRELSSLVFGVGPDVFDTREIRVFDGERLVGVSYFDVGGESLASQLALYDPEYMGHSLGFYTMLEEIEFGRENGQRFYYPGYVIPGMSSFEYKLRIGAVQYLEANHRWRRRAEPPTCVKSVERHKRRIAALERSLNARGIQHERYVYPGFWIRYMSGIRIWGDDYLQAIVHTRCSKPDSTGYFIVIEYLAETDVFQLSRVRPDIDLDIDGEYESLDNVPDLYEKRALVYDRVLAIDKSAAAIADQAILATQPALSPWLFDDD